MKEKSKIRPYEGPGVGLWPCPSMCSLMEDKMGQSAEAIDQYGLAMQAQAVGVPLEGPTVLPGNEEGEPTIGRGGSSEGGRGKARRQGQGEEGNSAWNRWWTQQFLPSCPTKAHKQPTMTISLFSQVCQRKI